MIVSFFFSSWDRYKIPIAHIHRCHLLSYEHQIVSVVLSHCCYSLRVGEAHTVQYDHQALEKHILDKFIHGKPRILSDEAQVVCRDTSTVTLDVVRKKISPQVRIDKCIPHNGGFKLLDLQLNFPPPIATLHLLSILYSSKLILVLGK